MWGGLPSPRGSPWTRLAPNSAKRALPDHPPPATPHPRENTHRSAIDKRKINLVRPQAPQAQPASPVRNQQRLPATQSGSGD